MKSYLYTDEYANDKPIGEIVYRDVLVCINNDSGLINVVCPGRLLIVPCARFSCSRMCMDAVIRSFTLSMFCESSSVKIENGKLTVVKNDE